MRIIAGKHRSRKLDSLKGMNTRPMMDRMKESVFNIIGPYFENDVVLDLFGGSGALSLEALSRGASFAYIIDSSYQAIKIITKNVETLGELDKVQIISRDYKTALQQLQDQKFDLIFLDPPYRLNIINEIINTLLDNNMINKNGYIICQYVKGNLKPINQLTLIKNYNYGNSEVSIYKMD